MLSCTNHLAPLELGQKFEPHPIDGLGTEWRRHLDRSNETVDDPDESSAERLLEADRPGRAVANLIAGARPEAELEKHLGPVCIPKSLVSKGSSSYV